MPQAVIIGAGPAGSLAALLLARADWHVTLIEQHTFPRDKVCGECHSALGITVLRRAGVNDRIARLKPVVLRRTTLHATDGDPVDLVLQQPMWGISRRALDAALLEAARDAGAAVIQPARCESLSPGIRPSVVIRDLVTNQRRTMNPDLALLADGKAALLHERPEPTGDFGIKTHFEDLDAPHDSIGLFGFRGCYGGVAPIEAGRFNLACSVPAPALQETRGDVAALFQQMLGENRHLRRQFRRARRVGPWLASPLPRFAVAPSWPPGILPLGNAAAAVEPIGGEGIGLALRSAELAATELIARPQRPRLDALRHAFNQLWRLRRASCRGAARVFSSPTLAAAAADLLRGGDVIANVALALIGKPGEIAAFRPAGC